MQYSQASMPFPSCAALTSPCWSVFTFHTLNLITHDAHGKQSLFFESTCTPHRYPFPPYPPPFSLFPSLATSTTFFPTVLLIPHPTFHFPPYPAIHYPPSPPPSHHRPIVGVDARQMLDRQIYVDGLGTNHAVELLSRQWAMLLFLKNAAEILVEIPSI